MNAPPIPAEPAEPTVEACAACAAPLAADQRYCLQCGEVRRGARRALPALLRDPRHPRETRDVVATPHEEDRWARLAAALAGVACLLLAMGVGVLIGRSGGEAPAPQAITIAAGAGAPAATQATAFTGDWPEGEEGWTIALDELPKASTQPDAVAAAKTAATGKGAAAVGALDSDTYPSLTAGSYVVYSGVHDSRRVATAALAPLKAKFADARVIQVSATASAPGSGSPSASAGGAAKGVSSSKRKSATAAQDTTKAFEETKKAPKTVGTGGKPPPKDGKPAAGGGDFEEIE